MSIIFLFFPNFEIWVFSVHFLQLSRSCKKYVYCQLYYFLLFVVACLREEKQNFMKGLSHKSLRYWQCDLNTRQSRQKAKAASVLPKNHLLEKLYHPPSPPVRLDNGLHLRVGEAEGQGDHQAMAGWKILEEINITEQYDWLAMIILPNHQELVVILNVLWQQWEIIAWYNHICRVRFGKINIRQNKHFREKLRWNHQTTIFELFFP